MRLLLLIFLVFVLASCNDSQFGAVESVSNLSIADQRADKVDENAPNVFGDEDREEDKEEEGDKEEDKEEEGDKEEDKDKEGDKEEDKDKEGDKEEDKDKEGDKEEDKDKEGDKEEDKDKEGDKENDKEEEGDKDKEVDVVRVCSYARTYGPYSPSGERFRRRERNGAPEDENNPKFLTLKKATRVTIAIQDKDGDFYIPKQNPEKNKEILASGNTFKMGELFLEEVGDVDVIYYSFHSDEAIEDQGKKVFAQSRLRMTRFFKKSSSSSSSQSVDTVRSFIGRGEISYKMSFEMLYNRRANEEEEAECDRLSSPLMIDLKGKGIKFTSQRVGMEFDIDGDGYKEVISCPKYTNTPFLALPKRGKIHGINQLFGDNTYGPDGEKAENGFYALAKYDENKDKVIDEQDRIFDELRLWDEGKNCNGQADRGELTTLKESGITAIYLEYKNIKQRDRYGNEARQLSEVETYDGMKRIFDIWFKTLD